MSDMNRAQLRTLCSYLALPGMLHAEAIAEEVRGHITQTPNYAGKLAILAAAGQPDLVDLLEQTHGTPAFASLDITDAAAVSGIAKAGIASEMRQRIFRTALRERLATGEDLAVAGVMAGCDSIDLHLVLIEECKVTAREAGYMLLEPRITESQAWRRHPEPFALLLKNQHFDKQLAAALSIDAITRVQVRAFAILIKLGGARPAPQMIIESSGSARLAGLCHEMSSHHRYLDLLRRLPSVEDLMMASSRQVDMIVDRALLPEDWGAAAGGARNKTAMI